MGALADTPLEIIDQIFSFATATDPPSVTCLREQPSLALLASQQCPVKNTSSTCRKLRRLCFNRLFSYLKIDASYTDALIAFVNYYNLVQYVESVVLYTKEQHLEGVVYHYDQDIPDTTPEMSPASQLKPAILAVMEHINPKSLVIMASPRSFANLVPYPVNLSDSWAFNIPNQILRLEQNDPTLPPSTFPLVLDFDIFAIRPWRRITYNEGSSIPAYCTYEYFNKCRPSLLATPYSETGLKAKSWLAYLTSLNFVAVFPFGHIEDVCQSLRSLQNLKYLAIQLAPSTTNGILDDRVALATCQRSDSKFQLWVEFRSAHYYFLNYVLVRSQESLIEYTILDAITSDLRNVLDDNANAALRLFGDCWHHNGNGKWTKHADNTESF